MIFLGNWRCNFWWAFSVLVHLAVFTVVEPVVAKPAEVGLLQLANEHFTNGLSLAEDLMFRSVASGDDADYTTGKREQDNPTNAPTWTSKRVIRADRLVWLCTDPRAVKLITFRGVSLIGARIDGELDLEWAKMDFPLTCSGCSISQQITLMYCNLRALDFSGTIIGDLDADGIKVENDILFRNGFQAVGKVIMPGSMIGGNLDCDGGSIRLKGTNGFALDAGGVIIGGDVLLSEGFSAGGSVSLDGATIKGDLDCSGGQFRFSDTDGVALDGTGIKVGGNVRFSDEFKAEGTVLIANGSIEGDLFCGGGSFIGSARRVAIKADSVRIRGEVYFDYGFLATGLVSLRGARLEGNVDCDGGKFLNHGTNAFTAKASKISASVFMRNGFRSEGGVELIGAIIDGDLDCDGGEFLNKAGEAISADGVKVGGRLFLRGGFHADGEVNFPGCSVTGEFQMHGLRASRDASFDLRDSRVGSLWDDPESWPSQGNLLLHGFVYDEIADKAPQTAGLRVKWLRLQPKTPFLPQPYEQASGALRKLGRLEDATAIMIAKNQDYARSLKWWSPARLWFNFLGELIGFGYETWRAFLISLIFILLGSFLFRAGYRHNLIDPADQKAILSTTSGVRAVSKAYPRFNAFVYSLETFIPLVKLSLGDYWLPNANAGNHPSVWRITFPRTGSMLRCYYWIHIIFGWVLTTLWVGGLSGLVRT